MSNRYSASKLREIRALGSRYAPGYNFTTQWHPIYNISPKCDVPVVVKGKEQPLRLMRWGTWTADGLLANELAETDRMPAILSDWDAIEWLGDKPLSAGTVGRLCQPYPAEKMSHWASPQDVSRTTFQDPSAIRPLPQNPSNN